MLDAHKPVIVLFFFNDTATTEIYTLSLHDALPISLGRTMSSIGFRNHDQMRRAGNVFRFGERATCTPRRRPCRKARSFSGRSEEHTSELQSRPHLVCRLLLEK